MDRLRDILHSNKNIEMLKSIVAKKLDAETVDWTRFNELFDTVKNTVFDQEIRNYSNLPLKTSVLKINNIVIKEACNYISNIGTPVTMSTILDYESDEEPEIVRDTLLPEFFEDMYEIGSNNMSKDGDVYISEIYVPNVQKLELLQIRVDNSDYIITEYCNLFEVDGTVLKIPPGNYNEENLCYTIQELIDKRVNTKENFLMKLLLNFEKIRDCYTFSITSQDEHSTGVIIDFNVPNSIGYTIGFDKKKYTVVNKLTGKKHHLSHSNLVSFDISYYDDVKVNAPVPLNVPYNSTKFYEPEYKKIYKSAGEVFTISEVRISLKNERGDPYDTREREFYIRFKVTAVNL